MIEDARARKNGQTVQKCEQCEYKTASKAMLRKHKRTEHRETEEIIVVQNNDPLPVVQNSNKNKENTKKKYISKRIQCDHCDKKFNKESRFTVHMKTDHIGLDTNLRSNKEKLIDSINESHKTKDMTFQYSLRTRVQQKQDQMSKSPSV